MSRHSRQERFAPIGPAGQRRLAAARVTVIGCGALGSVILDMLVRAGIGRIRLVDRDFVEPSNLQRQSLYELADAEASRAKAAAAAERLTRIDPAVQLEPVVGECSARTVETLVADSDLVFDGSDNFRTRHLVNEACAVARIPWVYGACVGSYGLALAITPGDGPCLACIQDALPGPGENPTCDTAGVIAPIVHQVAAWQVAEGLKLLVGTAPRRELWTTDLWSGSFQRVAVHGWRDPACAVCGPAPTFPRLRSGEDPAIVLCGRDHVQITRGTPIDLTTLTATLGTAVTASNPFLVRWRDDDHLLTAFADGRVLVQGVGDGAAARVLVDRWLG